MPAPKAVLCDIHDHGLDPSISYGRIATNGRLSNKPGQDVIVSHVKFHQPVHVELPVPKIEVKIEEKSDGTLEEKVDIEIGTLKMEIDVPFVEVDTKVEDIVDDIPPMLSDAEELVVVASSKKIRAKKTEKSAT